MAKKKPSGPPKKKRIKVVPPHDPKGKREKPPWIRKK